jgi:hypothetical protein
MLTRLLAQCNPRSAWRIRFPLRPALVAGCWLWLSLLLLISGQGTHAQPTVYEVGCSVPELISVMESIRDNDVISLAAGCTYTLTTAYGDSTTGLPKVNDITTIQGNGAIIQRSLAAGTPNFRLFHVGFTGNLTLQHITLRHGKLPEGNGVVYGGLGGAILNEAGTVTLINSTISNNTTVRYGGGIWNEFGTVTLNSSTVTSNSAASLGGGIVNNEGTVTLNNSTVSNNTTSGGYGGGIYNTNKLTVNNSTISGNSAPNGSGGGIYSYDTLTVNNSTISGNSAVGGGGGIYNAGGTVMVSNSTLSGNTSNSNGGGIYNDGSSADIGYLTVANSTIAGNSALSGGGIANDFGNIAVLGSSIVFDNSAPHFPNLAGTYDSLGYNVIGGVVAASITGTLTGNQLNVTSGEILLSPLANYDGYTMTRRINESSVAIGHGNCASLGVPPVTTDQRGFGRGSPCDAGAYENMPPTLSDITNKTTNEDTPTAAIPFIIGDADTSTANLDLSFNVVPGDTLGNENVVFGGSGANRTITITPRHNHYGTITIRVIVSDGDHITYDDFSLTITAVNDQPTISDIAAKTTLINVPTAPIAFTIGDVETAAANLTLTALSSNTTLLPTANIVFGGSGANRTVTLTPAANLNGTTTVTLVVRDANNRTANDSFVLTVVEVVGDAIFSDGFESGNLSNWTSSVTDGGDLSATGSAALMGSFGMQAVIDDTTAIYVTDDTPNAEPRYRARFMFDPNGVTMANNDNFSLFYGFQGTATAMLQVQLRRNGGLYQLRVAAIDDAGTWVYSDWTTISDAPHLIELDWQAASATGANNGTTNWWLDEAAQAGITTLDSDTRRVDRARLGGAGGIDAGTSGTVYFDAFISRRLTYIGRLITAPALVQPADASFVAREVSPNLSWGTVAGATQYYAEFSNGTTVNLNSGWIAGTSWSPGIQLQGAYTWRVKARNAAGEESALSSRTLTVRPGTPSNLQGTALSLTQVSLTWNASSDAPSGITGYRIYRAGVQVGTSSSSTPSFTDNAAPACAANQYKVRSVNGSVTSLDSTVITVNTPCDAIFSDGFESVSLSAWSLAVTDGTNLATIPGAQLTGSARGLRALINDANPLYVGDDTPVAERRYRARFYFDPNGVTMANNDNFSLFYGFQGAGTSIIQVQIRRSASTYQIRTGAIDDTVNWFYSGWTTISNDTHIIEIDWQAATAAGANNGTLNWWVDETPQTGLSAIDNDTRRVDRIRLGAVAGMDAGTSGTVYFDAFRSGRVNYIGAEVGGLGDVVEPTVEPTEEVTPEATVEPTAEVNPEATDEPTAEVTPEATDESTIEPTAVPTEEPTAVPEPTSTPTPTPEPTLLPFTLPVFQTMDDGAPLWSASAGWQLGADAAYNGLGWQAVASGQVETLALNVPVTLSGAAPTLSFQSKLVSGALPEVRLSLDGATWQTVAVVTPSLNWALVTVDLSAYAGQTIRLQFVWASPAGASDSWQVDEVTIADGAIVPPTEPTATETPDAPGTEPTAAPPDITVVAPREEMPMPVGD